MNSIIDFKNKKYCVVTYGCQMNLHESEKISGILSGMGMSAVNEPENADVVVFNTCCIRDTAERRALGNIGKMKELKKKNKNLLIVVTGCMTQQNGFAENPAAQVVPAIEAPATEPVTEAVPEEPVAEQRHAVVFSFGGSGSEGSVCFSF